MADEPTCHACGALLVGGDRFCGKCGTPHSHSAIVGAGHGAEPGIPDVPTEIAQVDPSEIAKASGKATPSRGTSAASQGRTKHGVGVPFEKPSGASEVTHKLPRPKGRAGCWVVLGLFAGLLVACAIGYVFRVDLAPVVGRAGLPNVAARMENLRPQQVVVRLPGALEQAGVRPSVRLTYDVPLPPEAMARLGERFFRVLGTGRSGSGLGWSIVQRIVRAHGLQAQVDRSEALGGLRVRLSWPAPA